MPTAGMMKPTGLVTLRLRSWR